MKPPWTEPRMGMPSCAKKEHGSAADDGGIMRRADDMSCRCKKTTSYDNVSMRDGTAGRADSTTALFLPRDRRSSCYRRPGTPINPYGSNTSEDIARLKFSCSGRLAHSTWCLPLSPPSNLLQEVRSLTKDALSEGPGGVAARHGCAAQSAQVFGPWAAGLSGAHSSRLPVRREVEEEEGREESSHGTH